MTVSAKKRAAQRARRDAKRQQHFARMIVTRQVHDEVWARAGGRCEAILGADVTLRADGSVVHAAPIKRCTSVAVHMDHFFGRARHPESKANCWALCLVHDEDKTQNRPSSAMWHRSFIAHAAIHGYDFELGEAMARLQGIIRARAESTVSLPRHLVDQGGPGDHRRSD